MSENSWLRDLLGGFLIKMMGEESQVQEHIQWTAETKGIIPVLQAIGAVLGLSMITVALGGLGWGVGRLVDVEIGFDDGLLVGVLLSLLLAVSIAVVQWVLRQPVMPVLVGFSILFALFIAAAAIVALFGKGADGWGKAAIIASPCLLVPGLALAYRQLMDLFDPLGKKSPVERMVQPYIPDLLSSGQPTRRVTVPYRINGHLREPTPYAKQDGDAFVVDLHREDMAFVEFIREAATRGLSRGSWLVSKRPNVRLPRSGIEVTRDVYDSMIEKLIEWDMVYPGGEGRATAWKMLPDEALELFDREIRVQLAEEE